ncbi:unnamed protein product [Sphagnum compactum]
MPPKRPSPSQRRGLYGGALPSPAASLALGFFIRFGPSDAASNGCGAPGRTLRRRCFPTHNVVCLVVVTEEEEKKDQGDVRELAICVSWSFCCGISALKHSFHIRDPSKTFSLQMDNTIVQKLCLKAVFDTAMQGLGMAYSVGERNESPPSPEVYAGPVPLLVVESGEPHHAFPC